METIHATQVVDMQHLSLFMLLMVNKFVFKYVVVELSGAYINFVRNVFDLSSNGCISLA